jgi:hypothetical protein
MNSFKYLSGIQFIYFILEQMMISFSRWPINQIIQMKLKSTTNMFALIGVYVVFKLIMLGSLLTTHSHSCTPTHSQLKSCGNGI